MGGTVYLPAGTYACSTPVTLPNSVGCRGDGDSSWLKGELVFASADRIEKLNIGAVGRCAVTNAADAAGTTFSDCRFHGGGSDRRRRTARWSTWAATRATSAASLHCAARSSARATCRRPASTPTRMASATPSRSTSSATCRTAATSSTSPFATATSGRFNGHASGALRMMLEAYTWDNHTGLVYHGWKDLNFEGCTIEASDTAGLDFADRLVGATGRHSPSGVLITGCTFLGRCQEQGLRLRRSADHLRMPDGHRHHEQTVLRHAATVDRRQPRRQGRDRCAGPARSGQHLRHDQEPRRPHARDRSALHQPRRLQEPRRRQHVHLRHRPRRGDRRRRVARGRQRRAGQHLHRPALLRRRADHRVHRRAGAAATTTTSPATRSPTGRPVRPASSPRPAAAPTSSRATPSTAAARRRSSCSRARSSIRGT